MYAAGARQEELVMVSTTNVGERPVIINSIGWSIGKGKRKRQSIQMFSGTLGDSIPKKIEHGETASFMISLSESPDWYKYFAKFFVDEGYTYKVKTLRAQIHTSVGHTENVLPEKNLLDKLEATISSLQEFED